MAGPSRGDHVYRDVRQRNGSVRCLSRRPAQQGTIPLSSIPISLNGERIAALVVGGGPVGTRKAIALSASGAAVRVVASVVSTELMEAAASGDLVVERREYAGPSDIGSSQLVIAATESREVNARVAADAHALFRLVSVADSPGDGSFMSMAVHRAGPIAVGVSAGNVPPAASRIRDAIAARFDERYGDAVAACLELRARVLSEQGSSGWAAIHPVLIGPDFCAQVENGTFSEELAACRS